MKKLGVLIFVLVCSNAWSVKGYDYTPVLIHLNKQKQSDTIGFNLVEHLPAIIYKRILDGSVPLWGSPLKKVGISAERLRQIEKESKTSFLDNNDLFINEFWRLFRKQFEFNVVGFSFFNRSETGVKVNYGFVDVADVKAILSGTIIPCNANGNRFLTYWEAIQSKRYDFDLVKFGKVDFAKKPRRSIELRKQAFECEKIKTNALVLPDEKVIRSRIVKSGEFSKNNNYLIYQSIEKYFNENKQEFLSLAPKGHFSHLDKNLKIAVEGIELVEYWDRDLSTGQITSHVVQITVHANGVQLKSLNKEQIEQLDILIRFRPLKEFLKDKSYDYIITKINKEEIPGFKASEIQKALETGPWHLISYTPKEE